MKDQIPKENWQLQEESTPDDKWLLQESEQQVTERWDLHEEPLDDAGSWQPVEYVKPPRKIGAWLLPAIIMVALLVVIGYTGFRVLPPLLGLNQGDPTPSAVTGILAETATPEAETDAGSVDATPEPVDEPAPIVAPEQPSPPPATPAPQELPTVTTVSQRFGIVNAPNGLNARDAASTDATVIRILEDGETLWVFDQQGEWLEIFVAETPLVVDQPFVGVVGFAAAEFFTLIEREVPERLVDQVLAFTGKAPLPAPEVPPGADETTEPSAPDAAASGRLTVTVNAPAGVNARSEPVVADGNVIRLVENDVTLPALARSADSQWIQVQLPDGVIGWIAAEFLVPSGDLTTLPIPGQEAAPVATSEADAETPPSTEVRTTGFDVVPPYTNIIPSDDVPAIYITVPDGVNVRVAPNVDAEREAVAPQGAVLPARGRSADGLWVQVELPTGVLGWVFRDTVNVTGAVGALPAVDGPAATATPTTVPAPVPLPTPTPTPDTDPASETVTATVIPFFLPMYAQPSSDSDTVARYARGVTFTVSGRTAGGDWLQVVAADGTTGWVVAGNVQVSGDLAGVPVVP